MDLSELYRPVEKIPNPLLEKGIEFPSGLQHAIQVTKSDGKPRIVAFCSELYHLLPNQSIVPIFLKEIERFYKVEVSYKIRNHSQFFIDMVIKDRVFKFSENDPVFPRVRLINSYDKSLIYQFSAGFWRLVCSNGMMAPVGGVEKFSSLHTPKIGRETSFEGVFKMISEFLASSNETIESYYELQGQLVKEPLLRIEEVVEETNFPKSLTEDVIDRFTHEINIAKTSSANDWQIYNAFNYHLNHNDGVKIKEIKREKADQEVLQYLLKY